MHPINGNPNKIVNVYQQTAAQHPATAWSAAVVRPSNVGRSKVGECRVFAHLSTLNVTDMLIGARGGGSSG